MMTRSTVAIVVITRSMMAMVMAVHTIIHKSRKLVSILVACLKNTAIKKDLAMEAMDIRVAMEAMEAMEVMEVMDTVTMKSVIQTLTAMDLISID